MTSASAKPSAVASATSPNEDEIAKRVVYLYRGQAYDTEEEAQQARARVAIARFAEEIELNADDTAESKLAIAGHLVDNFEKWISLLNKLY